MFDTSSFRIRYKAPVEKPALILLGPGLVLVTLTLGAISRFVTPLNLPGLPAGLLDLLVPIGLIALVALGLELAFGPDEGYAWRRSAAATGAGVLAGTLLVAAWGKILDPVAFERSLTQEGLGGLLPVWLVGLAAIGLEVFLGSALLLGVRRLWSLSLTALLVAFFLFLTGRAYLHFLQGVVVEGESCGCFGNLLERTPPAAFWQDFALLVPPLALACLGVVVRASFSLRTTVAALVAAAAVAVAYFAPSLPLDDLATRLHPGAEIGAMCTGTGDERLCLTTLLPELAQGAHLVVLADLEDEEFGSAVEGLNRYWQGANDARLWVLAAATPEQSQAFFWQHGPSFEIREAPAALLRPLYRTLPRSFRVQDGEVTQTYPGLPPEIGADPPTTTAE